MPEFLDRLLEFPLNDIEIFFGHAANFTTCVSGKEYGETPTTIVPLTQHDYKKRESPCELSSMVSPLAAIWCLLPT
jgi:hypothetical protein